MIAKCPKCGEPARYVRTLALVRCELHANGSIGRPLKAWAHDETDKVFECGGQHTWTSNATKEGNHGLD